MESIKLVFVFILLINLLLIESFETKNDLVSNNIVNLQQPTILNDEEDTNSIVKRQNRRRRRVRRRRRQNRNRQILRAIAQLQSQLASIATRLDSLTTTTTAAPARPNGPAGRIKK